MCLKEAIENAMRESGRLSKRERIEIINSAVTGSDYVRVEVLIYRRKKDPVAYWNICINIARELILWDHSTFYNL